MQFTGTAPFSTPASTPAGYAGDVSAALAWQWLQEHSDAMLVDVRTPEEWEQIGVPDLSSFGKAAARLSWRLSSGETNGRFIPQFEDLQIDRDTVLVLICKGGGRSRLAAQALTQAGYAKCYNLLGGVESTGGWKDTGLPCG